MLITQESCIPLPTPLSCINPTLTTRPRHVHAAPAHPPWINHTFTMCRAHLVLTSLTMWWWMRSAQPSLGQSHCVHRGAYLEYTMPYNICFPYRLPVVPHTMYVLRGPQQGLIKRSWVQITCPFNIMQGSSDCVLGMVTGVGGTKR